MKNRKELAALSGIIAGFTCLICFFIGAGVPTESIGVVGALFIIITIAICQVLISDKKSIK